MSAALRAAVLLFGSGFCALVYQTAWLRMLRLVFGASTAASAAVLAIFMGGLGFGGLLLGRRADRRRSPLGVLRPPGAGRSRWPRRLSPWLVALVQKAYLGARRQREPGAARRHRCPAGPGRAGPRRADLSDGRHAAGRGAGRGAELATAGAAWSASSTRSTPWAPWLALCSPPSARSRPSACARHLDRGAPQSAGRRWPRGFGADAGARGGARRGACRRHARTAAGGMDRARGCGRGGLRLPPDGAGLVPHAGAAPRRLLLHLRPHPRGGAPGHRPRRPALRRGTCGAAGRPCAASPSPARWRRSSSRCPSRWATGWRSWPACCGRWATPASSPWSWAGRAVTAFVVLPAALVAGYQFPLLVALLGRGRERVGREVGRDLRGEHRGRHRRLARRRLRPAAAAHRAGRLAAGRRSCSSLLGRGGAGRGRAPRRAAARPVPSPWSRRLSALLLLSAAGPTAAWRHSPIGAGRVDTRSWNGPNDVRAYQELRRGGVVWEADGVESSVALVPERRASPSWSTARPTATPAPTPRRR